MPYTEHLIFYSLKTNAKLVFQHDFQDLTSCFGYRCTRTKDGCYTCFIQEVVILSRNNTTGKYQDIFTTQFLQLGNKLRYQGLVSGSQ